MYVGTSASELLHFFQIPVEPNDDKTENSTFILASRLQPAFSESSSANVTRPGVQQILLLPWVGKACVLCNWTVTFYSLPELSPVFGTTQVKNCNWVGGLDLNERHDDDYITASGATILLSLNRRIQVVRIGEDARVVRKIDFAGSTISVRRDSFACVADSRSYALIDVEKQLKIPLMPISSLDDSQTGGILGQAQNVAVSGTEGQGKSALDTQNRPASGLFEESAHARSSSLVGLITSGLRRPEAKPSDGEESIFQEASTPARSGTPVPSSDLTDKALPVPFNMVGNTSPASGAQQPSRSATPTPTTSVLSTLIPHIESPTPEEFLIITGTYPSEPGIGMFVNLDGDPTRPTIEFDTYPKQIAVDSGSTDMEGSKDSSTGIEEGYILASLERQIGDSSRHGLEIQRWNNGMDAGEQTKYWLECPTTESHEVKAPNTHPVGIRSTIDRKEVHLEDVAVRLCRKRFLPFSAAGSYSSSFSIKNQDSRTATTLERLRNEEELFDRNLDSSQDEEAFPDSWEVTRNAEEEKYAQNFSGTSARLIVWSCGKVWWAIRNPLILQLESALNLAIIDENAAIVNRAKIFAVVGSVSGKVERTELEFYTFSYVRQRAGLLLFTNFLHSEENPFSDSELTGMLNLLAESLLDPRVTLSLIPSIRNEIVEGKRGIWVYGGVKTTLHHYISTEQFGKVGDKFDTIKSDVLYFLKRYLTLWRKKKGYGSVPDEGEVFRTVDAALLRVLLEIDQHSSKGMGRKGSVRAELYELVDSGVDCFDRAITLLESYDRLYVLSRLYQSRKMAGDVLVTWRRIINGEPDGGGEFTEGEQKMRDYLTKIGNHALVQEYAAWLAGRNPKLGVEVFADDCSRVKFEPSHILSILRVQAPDAVKYYLEHLVFDKGHKQYVNELIMYYLEVVLHTLQVSKHMRSTTIASYEAYRALRLPKPTYRQFMMDNAPMDDDVWHSRLNLLQLLGGAYDYDSATIRSRIVAAKVDGIDPVVDNEASVLLVPETIILDGRERQHENALRLLVHKLGDYDTAVRYCIRGGSSLFAPSVFTADGNKTFPPLLLPLPQTSLTRPSKEPSGKQYSTQTHHKRKLSHTLPLPMAEEQARLFRVLLTEFLKLQDVSDRVEQTSVLLERFGAWFDVEEVLEDIPDDWAVDVITGFLQSSMRRLVAEKRECAVTKVLAQAENLNIAFDRVEGIERAGMRIETG